MDFPYPKLLSKPLGTALLRVLTRKARASSTAFSRLQHNCHAHTLPKLLQHWRVGDHLIEPPDPRFEFFAPWRVFG